MSVRVVLPWPSALGVYIILENFDLSVKRLGLLTEARCEISLARMSLALAAVYHFHVRASAVIGGAVESRGGWQLG